MFKCSNCKKEEIGVCKQNLKQKLTPPTCHDLSSTCIMCSSLLIIVFTARRYAERGICYANSVCLSVLPSHAYIISKRLNVSSEFFHLLIDPSAGSGAGRNASGNSIWCILALKS